MIDAEYNHCCTFYSTMPVDLIPSQFCVFDFLLWSIDVFLDDETDAYLHGVLLWSIAHLMSDKSRHLSDDQMYYYCVD